MDEKELEKFTEFCDQTENQMDLLLDMEHSRVEMIKWKRDFIKQIIILSAWIIAFAIPILDKWEIIKNHCFYNISLLWFILCIIIWLIYFYWINKQEQDTYKNTVWFITWIKLDDDIISTLKNTTDWLKDLKEKLPNPIKFQKYEKWGQLSLLIIFIISLISMVISVITTNYS